MKYCSHCGTELYDQDNFCYKCGKRVDMVQPAAASQPTAPTASVSVQPPVSPPRQVTTDSRKEKGKKKKVILLTTLPLLVVIGAITAFFLLKPSEADPETEAGNSGAVSIGDKTADEAIEEPFEILPEGTIEFTGSEAIELEYQGPENLVDSVVPENASLGTLLDIQGSFFAEPSELLIGEISAPITDWTSEHIYAMVTTEIPAGQHAVTVTIGDQIFEAGQVTIQAPSKTEIISTPIENINENSYYETAMMNIFIPGGAMSKPDTLVATKWDYEKIELMGEAAGGQVDYYTLTLGDQHEFNDRISFAVPLPEGYQETGNTPLAMTLNEETGIFEPVFSEITDAGKLAVRTEHFSTFAIFWGYKIHRTFNDRFIIIYKDDDIKYAPSFGTMDALAAALGQNLNNAFWAYDPYGDNDTDVYFKNPVMVYLSGSNTKDRVYYNSFVERSVLYLPVTYPDLMTMQITSARGLFRFILLQNEAVYNSPNHQWLIEAMAEYASIRIANGYRPLIRQGTLPHLSFETVNGWDEYSKAAFFDTLFLDSDIEVDGAVYFEKLLKSYANFNAKDGMALLESVLPEGGINMATRYNYFWLGNMLSTDFGDYEYPAFSLGTEPVPITTAPMNMKQLINPSVPSDYGLYFQSFYLAEDKENVPTRFLKFTTTGPEQIFVVQRAGYADYPGTLPRDRYNIQMLSASIPSEEFLNFNPIGLESYDPNATYEVNADEEDMLMIIGNISSANSYKIEEIDAVAVTKSLVDVPIGEPVEFVFGFDGIYPEITAFSVKVDYGDGTTDVQEFPAQSSISLKKEHTYVKKPEYDARISLYDLTSGAEVLSAQLVIPIRLDVDIDLEASAYEAMPYDQITFEVNYKDTACTYHWNYGTDFSFVSNNDAVTDYTYKESGDYAVSVEVEDSKGNKLGSASKVIEVKPFNFAVRASNSNPGYGETVTLTLEPYDPRFTCRWLGPECAALTAGEEANMTSVTFSELGEYPVHAVVEDSEGEEVGSATTVLSVNDYRFTLKFNKTEYGRTDQDVVLSVLPAIEGHYYIWHSGSGEHEPVTSYENTQTFVYKNPELYPVWVEIFDEDQNRVKVILENYQILQEAKLGGIGHGFDNNWEPTVLVPPPDGLEVFEQPSHWNPNPE